MRSSNSIAATERPAPTRLPAWKSLQQCAARLEGTRVETLFSADAQRPAKWTFTQDGLIADLSKQLADDAVREALLLLAEQSQLQGGIKALFSGVHLNFTEDRAALHMALRGAADAPAADAACLLETSRALRAFARSLHTGSLKGVTGESIRLVVNLGIGGSDLGPRMAAEALPHAYAAPEVRFVANIDPQELAEALEGAEPASTLFIVSSKSFSTLETLANARAARAWLHSGLGADADISQHFAAVSNRTQAAVDFGIAAERIFAVPEWVGGRFSLWSAVGLPLLIAVGETAFDELLAGAAAMDRHFHETPLERNLPALLGLIGLWNIDFLGMESLAALPYAHGLRSFPAWLQQLEMESNGKHCLCDGSAATAPTAALVFGQTGTIGQHAFHQLLYQGTQRVAIDFIVPVLGEDTRSRALYQNALAQSAALMIGRDLSTARRALQQTGRTEEEVERLAPHLVCAGNQPSTTLILPDLSPGMLGRLLALYEHKTFVQGWIWGINSFDQYGVELGKEMARQITEPSDTPPHASTLALLNAIEAIHKRS